LPGEKHYVLALGYTYEEKNTLNNRIVLGFIHCVAKSKHKVQNFAVA
jgi:hypothetical protein